MPSRTPTIDLGPARLAARSATCLCLGLLSAPGALAASNDDPALTWRTVAVTGTAAPGTGEGITFLSFTSPLNHSIMAPQIDADGRLGFIAVLEGPGVVEGNRTGLWHDGPDGLQFVVRSGDPAPGTGPGITFLGVPSEYLPFPPTMADARLQFQGELTGPGIDFMNQSGVWREEADGSIALLARGGDPAPGLPGLACDASIGGFLTEPGTSIVIGGVTGTGVTDANDDVIWSDRSGTMRVLVREGEPAPGTEPGVVIGRGTFGTATTFPAITANRDAFILVAANLLGPGLDAFDDEALFRENVSTGVLELVVREGDPAPGLGPGVTIGGSSVLANIRRLDMSAAGHVVFTCRIGGATTTSDTAFTDRDGGLGPLLPHGTALPGVAGVVFGEGFLATVHLNDADRVTMTHFVPDDDDPHTTRFGVWTDRDGAWAPAVLPGAIVAHDDRSIEITSATASGFNAEGEILAGVTLDDPVIGYRNGLALVDAAGDVHVLAATGDEFDVAGDGTDVRDVIRVVEGGLSASGAVAFRLDFADGASAHVTASLRDCNADGLEDGGQIADGALADLDGDGVPDICDGPDCPADVTGDAVVDVADLVAVITAWGTADSAADVDDDGTVAVSDLVAVITAWGDCG